MSLRGRRFGRLWGLVLLLGQLAGGGVVGAARPAQEGIRIVDTSVSASFPNEVLFSITVESDSEIVSLELSYRVSGDPYTRSRWPEFTSARQVEATYRLDTQIEHYAPGSEFHYYWTLTDAAGRQVESPEEVFFYEDDRFDWQELSSERVAVFWYEGDEAFGQRLLDTAVRALDRLERDVGVEATRLIRIYVYGKERDFRRALGPNAPEWIGGQALPGRSLIVAWISPDAQEYGEIERMLPHELSHVVLYQATHNPYTSNPTWVEEGIAVHNQEVPDADFPALVEEAAREGRLIPLRALAASFPSDTDLALLSYAESVSIIEFILDQYGEEGLAALVDVLAEGETAEVAVERALGVSLEELEEDWRATLPAAVRTPLPGAEPSFSSGEEQAESPWPRLIGSAIACTGGAALLAVLSGILIILRQRARRKEEEEEEPPALGPY